ncbi:hypothetical protein ACG7TL_006950 [Trametes sanguinea]
MARRNVDDGFVEDSEEEDIMTFGTSAPAAKAVAGSSSMPPPPLPQRWEDSTVSSIQTAEFTDLQSTSVPITHPIPAPNNAETSAIQTPNFTLTHSVISEISSFGPQTRPAVSSIRTAQTPSNPANSSISTSNSASSAPRPKPRPRPAYKKPDVAVVGDTSFSVGSSSAAVPSPNALDRTHSPPIPPVEPMIAPSHVPSSSSSAPRTANKVSSGKERVSDSGIEMADLDMLYTHDIAERAKLRSRARTQGKAKDKAPETSLLTDDVIELSTDDDELSILPKAKPKAKPKPRSRKAAVGPSKEGTSSADAARGNANVSIVVPPRKRTKTAAANPDPGFDSDVNTIPMPTSDFPVPANIPTMHSSQLPPSDPPPSTSSSARTHPLASQESRAANGRVAERDLSPLSSPPPPMPRKRKRPNPPALGGLDSEEDTFGTDSRAAANADQQQSKAKADAPAARSLKVVPETQPHLKPKPASRKKRKDMDEDADGDWAGDAPTKPSKSTKKTRVTDDDDFGDDNDDDDWGASNGKGKSKGKGKKAAKKAVPKGKKGKANAKGNKSLAKDIEGPADEAAPTLDIPAADPKQNERAGRGRDAPWNNADTEPAPELTSKVPDVSAPKRGTAKSKAQSKKRALVLSDEDEDDANVADKSTNSVTVYITSPIPPPSKKNGRKSFVGDPTSDVVTKENEEPDLPLPSSSSSAAAKPVTTPNALTTPSGRSNFSHANRSYTISAKSTKHTPMSELIRRASAQPGSPFPTTARPTYSPLVKASKSTLRRIAPLHPNRRTPPPPPPRAPPPKKSKKMLELEEKWEMELQDSVEGWYAMSEEERAALRRAKKDAELGFFED